MVLKVQRLRKTNNKQREISISSFLFSFRSQKRKKNTKLKRNEILNKKHNPNKQVQSHHQS